MNEKLKKTLKVIKNVIEELWTVFVIIWNMPIGCVELLWTGVFDREKFKYNWNLLVEAIKGKSRYE